MVLPRQAGSSRYLKISIASRSGPPREVSGMIPRLDAMHVYILAQPLGFPASSD